MFEKRKSFRLALASSLVASTLLISACGDDDDDEIAQVRVIHASPDAPAVNIRLDGATAISDLDFGESSGYLSIEADETDVVVEALVPGGNLDVITVPDFDFEENQRYTIMAVNTTASIEPLVASDSASNPSASEVAVSVVHAATAAGNVDVYVNGPGVDINTVVPNFTFDFKDQIDAGALPGGTYQIRVTAPGTKTVVYDSGDVDLTPFAGEKLLISAINTVNSTSQDTAPIKLLVATDSAAVTLLDTATQTGARVVHLSPDAGTAAGGDVEVFATSTVLPGSVELIPAFGYTDIVPAANAYVGVPAGDYVFDVAPDTNLIDDSVFTSGSLTLAAGTQYSVIAAGYVLTTPAFGLLATADDNRSVVTQASVKVIHAAPAAGDVDVFVTAAGAFTTAEVESGAAGAPLLNNFAFAEITDYVAVAPGNYDIRVVAGGMTAIDVPNVNLAAGSVSTVIARESDGVVVPTFGVILLTN